VKAVTYDTAFVGYFRDPKQRVLVIGDAVPSLFDVYPEVALPNDQKEAFMHDRSGAVVSDEVAAKMGWHIGQTIPVQDGPTQANGSRTWLFHIDGIFHENMPEGSARFMNAHYDYINDGFPPSARKDTVDKFDTMVDDPKNVDSVAAAIDARFANSSPDTRTQTVQEEALSEMRQFGDVGAIITYVGLAVFASMLLITGNTMANSVRERLNEFAMMRAVGFGRVELAFIVFRESAVLVSVGAALGLLVGWGLVRLMSPVMTEVLTSFSLTWWAVTVAAALALLFALATGFLPGRQIARMPVAATLRRM
jgi:putative ABC transport system permease protein